MISESYRLWGEWWDWIIHLNVRGGKRVEKVRLIDRMDGERETLAVSPGGNLRHVAEITIHLI
jgi:hypothetical protein